MAALALALGLTAIALGVALTFARTSSLIGLSPLLEGAVAVCIALGLVLSVLSIVRRGGRTIVMPLAALVVNAVALGAVAIIILGQGEPTFDEAMLQLVEESGVAVQRIEGAGVDHTRDSRPALIVLPSGYYRVPLDERPSIPLVFSLHGYSSHYMDQDSYFGMSRLVNSYNFALVLPNGKRDDVGNRFWNATDFCCGMADTKPDDVAYLMGLVEEAAERVNIDRVFVTGMSNGGFMSYRLACESLPGLRASSLLPVRPSQTRHDVTRPALCRYCTCMAMRTRSYLLRVGPTPILVRGSIRPHAMLYIAGPDVRAATCQKGRHSRIST